MGMMSFAQIKPSKGIGSNDDPYQISTLDHLRWVSENTGYWSSNYILTADIDATDTKNWNNGKGFQPIGELVKSDWNPNEKTCNCIGLFDGQGHVISNLTINRPEQDIVGLFVFTSKHTLIKNIGLKNAFITGKRLVGGLVGFGTAGTVKQSFVKGIIQGEMAVGAIMGTNKGAKIFQCFAVGEIIASKGDAGGIAGYSESEIIQCYSTAKIEGNTKGGILGDINRRGEFRKAKLLDNYWDIETSGVNILVGNENDPVPGKTTEEFSDPLKLLNLDFDYTWAISTISDIDPNPRPYLLSQLGYKTLKVEFSDTIACRNIQKLNYDFKGNKVKVEAEPTTGHQFKNWSLNGEVLSDQNPFYMTLEENTTIQANFIKVEYQFSGGDGSLRNPYQISSLEDLEYLSTFKDYLNNYFELTADIDATSTKNWHGGKGFRPIGSFSYDKWFEGDFNGNGYTISNLYINRTSEDKSYLGLFARLWYCNIKNLGLENTTINGLNNAGIIAGESHKGSITNCFTSGNMTINHQKYYEGVAGGIVGISSSNISHCFTDVTIVSNQKNKSWIGGIAGINNSSINTCFAQGLMLDNGPTGYIKKGGIAASETADNHVVTKSYWNKESTATITSRGSAAEFGLTNAQVSDSTTFIDWDFDHVWSMKKNEIGEKVHPILKLSLKLPIIGVTTNFDQAIRQLSETKIYAIDEEATVEVISEPGYVFKGWFNKGVVLSTDKKYSFRVIESIELVAQFDKAEYIFAGGHGTINSPYKIETLEHLQQLSNDSDLWDKHFELIADIDATSTSESHKGKGFSPIGEAYYNYFSGSFNGKGHTISNLTIKRKDQDDIGLFGYVQNTLFIKRLGLINVDFEGNNSVGGLIGLLSNGTISECFSTGEVNGNDYVGGFLGYVKNGTTNNNFSSVDATARNGWVGGFLGYVDKGVHSNNYATGIVNGKFAGGFIGRNGSSSITKSYWDHQTSNQYYSSSESYKDVFAWRKTTKEFSDITTFVDWDFKNTWILDSHKRPLLRWQFGYKKDHF